MPSNAMITIFFENCNPFSQETYDSIINSIQFHQLECSKCKHSGCLTIHGYYYRYLKQPEGLLRLRVCRVYCSECNSTHALIPCVIVPYSQISVSDQCQICHNYENGISPSEICEQNPSIDENNVKYIVRNYRRRWREMLYSVRIFFRPLDNLVRACFSNYSTQFMQIHRRVNILFFTTT